MWNGHLVTMLFDLDQITLRAAADGTLLRTRTYDVLDASGRSVGNAVQGAGSVGDTLKRNVVARSRLTMPADVVVRDAEGGVLLSVAKRRAGLLLPSVRIEAALADGAVVAVARSRGRSAREYDVLDPRGGPVGTLRRGPAVLFAIADPAGEAAGSVALEPNTLSAQRAGTAHPHGYALSFVPGAPTLLRIGALATVLGFDTIRGM